MPIANHLNPFFPQMVLAPQGFSVFWTTCFPLMSTRISVFKVNYEFDKM